ncbi:tetratricopeptide repeat protein SKI3 isoform X1 [Canna indica]|uniref:Tetratricopeptide repeat protein SKI3 isoform X1 n=1 Tax=Canna indica TaxID=4628 RepID=A0AAQ3KSV1_9LILI|nr:tetratricopeptide repeat protein SKI3 isoform X1 [Canna indica]
MLQLGDQYLLRQLQETLDSDPDNPSHHYNLGLYLWESSEAMGDCVGQSAQLKERAAEHFMASAKLNPSNGAAFRFLGHYYSRVSVDAQRSAKCYQRAVTLDPFDSEAGEALCDMLDGDGKESLEIAVCKEASEKSPRAFWAFQRLGYLQVHQRKWSEAVPSLQHAIRGFPTCTDLWEALGLAYHRLGMFTAAIKSYGRAIELDNSRIFALLESGYIQLMLGSFRKGVEQFRCALELAPCNLSAHFGLASGLLGWSKDCIKSGAFVWAADLLREASEAAKTSTSLSGNLYSAWKLQGDIQIAYTSCFPWESERSGYDIDEELFKSSITNWKNTCHSAAKNAKLSYQRALHLAPWHANIYADIAISVDLIDFLEDRNKDSQEAWQLPERMALGGLLLEGVNKEFWVLLGSLASTNALKQHALIRGLELDLSLSEAWAFLGKLYRNLGEKQLANQAFDHARSIDPSLALPWAGMSANYQDGLCSANEAYESCLWAVQILPLAEFQVGLAALAVLSGQVQSPQVLGAIGQAVQRAPYSPESHNLHGLVCESRKDYQSAIMAYQRARCLLKIISNFKGDIKSCLVDVSVNLARSLCKAGRALDAVHECENLNEEGLLDAKSLQIYAVALWKLGQYNLALTMARKLAEDVSTMKHTSAAAALGLICTLTYNICGFNSVVTMIRKFPSECLRSSRMSLIVCALNALDRKNQLHSLLPSIPQTVVSHGMIIEMHSITAIGKMLQITGESNQALAVEKGVNYLRKALHMYPNSTLIRSHLGSLLLSSDDLMAPAKAARCAVVPTGHPCPINKGFRLPYEIHGAAAAACHSFCSAIPKFSFPTCNDELMHGARSLPLLQRRLHQEPWNQNARYLLILSILQKAREEKFPHQLCIILKHLILDAISREKFLRENKLSHSRSIILLLCASEISLQTGDFPGCIRYATDALNVLPTHSDLFFAHLQLCRAYAVQEDYSNLRNQYTNCLQIKTNHPIGWLLLKYLESRYSLQNNSDIIEENFRTCIASKGISANCWIANFELVSAQCYMWHQDYFRAEQALTRACAANTDSCLLLCHGAICMELARQQGGPQFVSRSISSLTKAQNNSPTLLPIVSLLLAQAEASFGAKAKWEKHLSLEWFAWPAEMRPAELYFQMHLLAKQPSTGSTQDRCIAYTQSSERWIQRAIHLNPSCLRYWRTLEMAVAS